MNTKLLYFLLPLVFSKGFASMPPALPTQDKLNTQLINAAKSGSTIVMIDLLRKGAKVNACDNYRNTALHWAAREGHLACEKALIEANADLNARNSDGDTSLHWAAINGHIDCVNALIEAKTDLNARDTDGDTSLHFAARNGHLDCLKALIEANADLNALDHEEVSRALHVAAMEGHLSCLKALIEAKTDLNSRNENGWTALHFAAENDHVACIKALIETNADLNARDDYGNTALRRAAINGHVACIKALIEANANLNALDQEEVSSALTICCKNNSVPSRECVKQLANYLYVFAPSKEAISQSRQRVFNALLQFEALKRNPELENLKSASLQFEILSRNKLLQEDLVIILLDELRKGNAIPSNAVALIRSKEAAVSYLLKKLQTIFSKINLNEDLFDPTKVEENFQALVKEGLDQRIEHLKGKGRTATVITNTNRPKPLVSS